MKVEKIIFRCFVFSFILTTITFILTEIKYWNDHKEGLVNNTGCSNSGGVFGTITLGGAMRYRNSPSYKELNLFGRICYPEIEDNMSSFQKGMTRPLFAFHDTIFLKREEQNNHFWLFFNLFVECFKMLAIPFFIYYIFINLA
jgi:hypothetical protein